jgi:hypothetical protein
MASDTSNSSAFKASLRLSLHAHAEKQASGHDDSGKASGFNWLCW